MGKKRKKYLSHKGALRKAALKVFQGLNDNKKHTAFSIIISRTGKILVLKKNDPESSNHQKWELPGGGIDVGENPLQAACRETEEEAKKRFSKFLPFGTNKAKGSKKQREHMFFLIFTQDEFHPDFKRLQKNGRIEHTDFKWCNLSEILTLSEKNQVNKHHKPFLKDQRKRLEKIIAMYRKSGQLPIDLPHLHICEQGRYQELHLTS